MKIGHVERLVLLLLKERNNKAISTNAISTILRIGGYVRTARSVSRAVYALKRKGLINDSNSLTQAGIQYISNMKDDNVYSDIDKLLVNSIDYAIRLGSKEKKLLYILTKIDHASLQFLAMVSGERVKNASLALNRLEEKGLVYGYTNRIMFTNSRGLRYRPKYFGITDLGKVFFLKNEYEVAKEIDAILEETLKINMNP